jgi:hypothetical protein
MARFVDRMVQDGHDSPIDVIIDPDEKDLIDARHRRLRHHWWAAYRERNALPLREDFSVSFLADIGDYLTILEKVGPTLRYEYYGRGVAHAYGRDLTGRTVDDFPSSVTQVFRTIYHLAEVKIVPIFMRQAPISGPAVEHWLRLIVPVSNDDPAVVTHFITCNVPVGGDVRLRAP